MSVFNYVAISSQQMSTDISKHHEDDLNTTLTQRTYYGKSPNLIDRSKLLVTNTAVFNCVSKQQLTIRRKVKVIINQWELGVKTGNLLEARENEGDQVDIGFNFAFDWSRWWCEFSGPITERGEANPNQSQISFDIRLKNRQSATKTSLMTQLNSGSENFIAILL